MTLDDVLFIEHLPTLDLHGLDRQSAKVEVNDFIKDNQKMKNTFVVIIHGIGTGTLRRTTKEVLKANKNVYDFKIAKFNQGCTIVQIKN